MDLFILLMKNTNLKNKEKEKEELNVVQFDFQFKIENQKEFLIFFQWFDENGNIAIQQP